MSHTLRTHTLAHLRHSNILNISQPSECPPHSAHILNIQANDNAAGGLSWKKVNVHEHFLTTRGSVFSTVQNIFDSINLSREVKHGLCISFSRSDQSIWTFPSFSAVVRNCSTFWTSKIFLSRGGLLPCKWTQKRLAATTKKGYYKGWLQGLA